MHRRLRMSVAEISYQSHIRQNRRIYGCVECTSRMMGTPCFLLESFITKAVGQTVAEEMDRFHIKYRIRVRLNPVVRKKKTLLTVPDEKPWTNVPNLNFDRDDRKIKLNYNWSDNYNSNWAVPSFVRDSPSRPLALTAGGCLMKVILTILRAFFLFLEAATPSVNKRC